MSDDDHAAAEAGPPEVTGWAKYIREITSRPGWSVARLAEASGIRASTIYRWRRGDVVNVGANSVQAIARAVGDDPDKIILRAGDAVQADEPDGEATDHITAWERQMVWLVYKLTWLSEEQQLQRIVRIRQIAAEQRAIEDDLKRRTA